MGAEIWSMPGADGFIIHSKFSASSTVSGGAELIRRELCKELVGFNSKCEVRPATARLTPRTFREVLAGCDGPVSVLQNGNQSRPRLPKQTVCDSTLRRDTICLPLFSFSCSASSFLTESLPPCAAQRHKKLHALPHIAAAVVRGMDGCIATDM